jgi:hypothetical protein
MAPPFTQMGELQRAADQLLAELPAASAKLQTRLRTALRDNPYREVADGATLRAREASAQLQVAFRELEQELSAAEATAAGRAQRPRWPHAEEPSKRAW